MATTRIMPLHTGVKRSLGKAISEITAYVKDEEKTKDREKQKRYVTGYLCNPSLAAREMEEDYRMYQMITHRTFEPKHSVIAYHLRQSFKPGEVTPEEAHEIGKELAMRYTKGNHAFLVCTHLDRHHLHNHIIIGSVNKDYTRKMKNEWFSYKAIQEISDMLCVEHGLSIIKNPKKYHGLTYNKWLGDKAKVPYREQMRDIIDDVLDTQPKTMEAFYDALEQRGIEIKNRSCENPSLRFTDESCGQKKFVRMDTLGDMYSPITIAALIKGQNYQNRKRRKKTAISYVDRRDCAGKLLIDIQQKIQEGKGEGYRRWATQYNLKQVSRSVIYLQQHGLSGLNGTDELDDRIAEYTAWYESSRTTVNDCERRLKEISEIRSQILDYARTRDAYREYQQRGYKKDDFYQEHEDEIVRHLRARDYYKAYFPNGNAPKIGDLKAEYDLVLEEKKNAIKKMNEAKTARRELLTAKSNLDMFLGDKRTSTTKTRKEPER